MVLSFVVIIIFEIEEGRKELQNFEETSVCLFDPGYSMETYVDEVTFDLCLTGLYVLVIQRWVVGEEAFDWK